ncbi:E3 ubiquitin-protein ligase [Dirofilaria immitis]
MSIDAVDLFNKKKTKVFSQLGTYVLDYIQYIDNPLVIHYHSIDFLVQKYVLEQLFHFFECETGLLTSLVKEMD